MNLDKYDKKHRKALDKHGREVQSIIDEARRKAVDIAIASGYDGEGEFYFEGAAQEKINELLHDTAKQITANITAGITDEWALSAAKMTAIVEYAGHYIKKLPKGKIMEWTASMNSELEKFKTRKVPTTRVSNHKIVNLDLSSRVWNLSGQFKEELELAVEAGMEKGMSATELSRKVRKYLNEPDRLFRRVRDKSGKLRLSKAAQAYHPGIGVYRSSYMNALRMTATEINTAYRTADYLRWKQTPFILGIEVHITDTHRHVPDICDDLKGKYPKDFKFTGWHPWCRCYAVPILPSVEEFASFDMDAPHHAGEVTDVPENFKKWVGENEERVEHAKHMPNFLKDNEGYWKEKRKKWKEEVEDAATKLFAERKAEYDKLFKSEKYRNVAFNAANGGLKASHINHNFDEQGGKYELQAQSAGYNAGHAVIFGEEKGNVQGLRYVEGTWDGLRFEVAGSETATSNNIVRKLSHCAAKPNTEIAIIVYPKGGYNMQTLQNAIDRFKGLENSNPKQFHRFKRVVCVQDEKIVYDEPF